jgi:serine/threonine protein kinase
MALSETNGGPLIDLLLRWEERRQSGEPVSAEELCADCPELLGELRRHIDQFRALEAPRREDSTGDSSDTDFSTALQEDSSQNGTSKEVPDSAAARYRRLRFHARGGLGEVFVARDEELRRDVALKEMQSRFAHDPGSRAQFVAEAEITGNLEHPGIVPVYGLGHYGDGRPYYAMRFIRGESLKEAIDTFHRADDTPGRDPGERTVALRRLLQRFLDICDAVAYAHSRRVLHRDLKPGNVMLGKYGETLVVDWGLAKPLGRNSPPATPHSSHIA